MNRQLNALMLAVFAFGFTSSAASAQTQAVDPQALPQAKWYKHRPQIQIVNENPDITNTMRGPDPKKVLLIPTGQNQKQQVQYILAPSPGGPGVPAGAVDLSQLPQAGFSTNMPLNPNGFSKRDSLPQGQSTGGLSGKQLASGRLIAPRSGQPVAAARTAPAATSAPAEAMAYKPYNSSGTGTSGGSSVKTVSSVSGKLERGSLIGKTK